MVRPWYCTALPDHNGPTCVSASTDVHRKDTGRDESKLFDANSPKHWMAHVSITLGGNKTGR